MRGISMLAIIVGGVTDVALSSLMGIPLALYVIASRHLGALPQDRLQPEFLAALHGSPALHAAQIAIGAACSIVGGLIAASIAKERRMLNGVLASWLCVGLGAYALTTNKSGDSALLHVLLIMLTFACYGAGAYVRVAFALRHRQARV